MQKGYHMAAENAPSKSNTPDKGQTVMVPTMFERWVDALKTEARLSASEFDARTITATVADAMLSAGSLEEAITAQDAGIPSGKDMKDIEHTVLSWELAEGDSKYEEHSLGVYMRVHAQLIETALVNGKLYQPGEEIDYAVGAANVMTLLYVARREDRLPLDVVIRSKPTGNGELLLLRLVPSRAVRASAS
jgi:hypothetical protein